MYAPRISVLIPTYNRATTLPRAVQSALRQTLAPYEIIVIDDGSTDGTRDVLRSCPSSVRYLQKPNGGVSSARNCGFRESTGDIIFLLDSDDYWHATWVERAVEHLGAHPDYGAVCANVENVDAHGQRTAVNDLTALTSDGTIALPRLFQHRIAAGSNLAVRRDAFATSGGFDERLRTGEDIDFVLRLAVHFPIAHIPEILVSVTSVPLVTSLSASVNTGNRLLVFDNFESHFPEAASRYLPELRDARANTALSYARDLLWERNFPAARARLRQALKYRMSLSAAWLLVKSWLLELLTKKR